ncbi:MAG TPA: hypothetical protein VFD94_05805 [Jatrophihabitans sp.]|nr:hypothetical protein [Jatrophihabitans sp.]
MRPRMIKIGTAAVALLAGGGFAVVSPSSTAVAFSSPPLFLDVSVQSPGTLVARGAAVSVPVIVTCNSQGATVQLQVTERVGKKVATGNTYAQVGCTGGHETVLITVPASAGQAFAKGSAFATADIFGCTANFVCGDETSSATIRLK